MRGIYLSESRPLRYGVFFGLYVMQGLPAGFGLTATANYLSAEGVPPGAVGAFAAMVGLPWAFQFAWGPLIDRFQGSPMGRRRPWVLGAQLLSLAASTALIAVRDPSAQLAVASWAFLAHSVFASIQDAAVDALAISTIPGSERGRVNAFMRGGFLAGTGAGAAALSWAIRRHGFPAAALAQALALLTMTLLTFAVRERPGDALLPGRLKGDRPAGPAGAPDLRIRDLFAELARGVFARPSLRLFAAIATGYLGASVFVRAFSMHLIGREGWSDTDLSVLSGTLGTLTALGVVVASGWLSDRFGHRRMLVAVLLALGSFLVGFALLAPRWADRPFARGALVAWYGFDPALSVAAMPALMAICRRGVEGSQFTAYMALVNLCDVAGSYLAGRLMGVVPAPAIGLGCGVAILGAALSIVRTPREAGAPPG